MKVAALQMVSSPDVAHNLATAQHLLEQAAAAGAELAALPEYFCGMGYQDTDKLAWAEADGAGPIQDWLAHTARTLQMWIVGGTIPLHAPTPGRVYNSTLVMSPQGARVARYDKIHLFRFDNGRERFDESRVIEAGTQPVQFAMTDRSGTPWTVGLSICYDLRFAALYRAHAQAGAHLLMVPSAFTYTTGSAHWEVLLRARAIENLAYVLAPAQGGQHANGRHTWGQSMLVDPWGRVAAQQAQGEAVVLGTLDAAHLAQVRTQLPALDHHVL